MRKKSLSEKWLDPGVYHWTCSYHTPIDRESGQVDDYDFEVEESVLLWSPDISS